MIGATTLDEYRERIEKDPALERRFQQVFVGEPSVEDTIAILRGLRERYEAHHKVRITDSALVAAASLSNRYITARQLPDKAIDLIDEAASRLRMEIDSSPEEIDQLRRTIDRMTMQAFALEKEEDEASKERYLRLAAELADAREELRGLEARWEAEKSGLNRVGELAEQIDRLRGEAERAQREGDLTRASQILYGQIPELEAEIKAAAEADKQVVLMVAEGSRRPTSRGGVVLTACPRRCCRARQLLSMESSSGAALRAARRGRRSRMPCAAAAGISARTADGGVPVPGPHWRRQDRAGQVVGRVPVRRRACHGPHRHERVRREAHRVATGRRAPGVRGTMRGPADRAVRRRPYSAVLLTRSRRHTRTCSTSCCRCSTTGVSPTARGARSTSGTRS